MQLKMLWPVIGKDHIPHITYYIYYLHVWLLPRMNELATPIVRDTMDHVQFNPDAFNVSEAAKKAKASAHIEELSQPITRGK